MIKYFCLNKTIHAEIFSTFIQANYTKLSMLLLAKKVSGKVTWYRYKTIASNLWLLRSMSTQPRYNPVNIQMLSESLHKQIFKNASEYQSKEEALKNIVTHLHKHGLSCQDTTTLPEVDLKLPPLYGQNIDDHFTHIANEQLKDYKILIDELISKPLPEMPLKWEKTSGWTKYYKDGTLESVPFPEDQGLIFDIECLMSEGNYPTMGMAVSSRHWYSWVSDYVIEDKFRIDKVPQLRDLIPLETKRESNSPPGGQWRPRLIIGHNVGFDRSFVKEQYFIQGTLLRCLDTLSMHVAVCGLTSFQRLLHVASGKDSQRKEVVEHMNKQKRFGRAVSEGWKKISSLNNLKDVHKLHCGGAALDKSTQSVFVEGTMKDVREQFQDLMTYCANDVKATHEVFVKLWPEFMDRFPHPVTLAGMLEMGTAYLPINDAWPRYLQHADSTYVEQERELKKLLMSLANDACHLMENQQYKKDPWLWDLDWSTSPYRLKKASNDEDPSLFEEKETQNSKYPSFMAPEEADALPEHMAVVRRVYSTAARVPKKPTFMSGYPAWYKELCPRPKDEDFYPGPSRISTQCRVTPKLMRLMWEGFPVHYDDDNGWGYLVSHTETLSPVEAELRIQESENQNKHNFPLSAFRAFVQRNESTGVSTTRQGHGEEDAADMMDYLNKDFDARAMELDEKIPHLETTQKKRKNAPESTAGPLDIGIPGVNFYKIPHKDGGNNKVGNPLARDYLLRVEDGTLTAGTGPHANRVLNIGRTCSYWKNNHKRIMGQMLVWLKKFELDKIVTSHSDYESEGLYGAIIPRIITSGTVTRRAVEPTWLTASNASKDRIGSELKAMVQTPPGYTFVGADVDSQELWIAAVLGDAFFLKEHGCTALGWMTLQGNKANKTDLHSKTAHIANISRDQAKVMNYGRIYGGGLSFAAKLLMQFNPQLSQQQASQIASNMYKKTKGQRNAHGKWIGGTESFMFNALEAVACSEDPRTPVLGCKISKALDPLWVLDDFMTSRINWVVQSSAVDYLHLMLVCMRWLLSQHEIQARFSISIHDEVRYLVTSSHRYRAALALQVTNLLTRCMFSYKLGMSDLPQSVAFFSAVDIDVCLRKEVEMDCVTPSNPYGLHQGYAVPPGESLDIYAILEKTAGKLEENRQIINKS